YWNWSGGRYVWIGGIWHRARPGYVYYQPRWERYGGHWRMRQAYWGRDSHWRGRHHDNGRHRGWDRHGNDRGHGHGRRHH
ncbi:MAG TPA: hypothetical protein VFP92_13340, partial [Rhodanobacteraceae bacterium]|nr:hypothetical protein [Rhodanobacteraceae bacterium]